VGSVAVLGAGLAGLAAFKRLRQNGIDAAIYEKNDYMGGHAASHTEKGFIFDEGPHVSFTKQEEIQNLFSEAVRGQFLEQNVKIQNFWRGLRIDHPTQCNLYKLPLRVKFRCLRDFVGAVVAKKSLPTSYLDWCYQNLGKTFADEFSAVYTRKYWTVDATDMTADWVGQRVYAPKLADVLWGACFPAVSRFHYLLRFRYPLQSGFGSYAEGAFHDCKHIVNFGYELNSVDVHLRQLEFRNGTKTHYETLISSLPLPELIERIKDVPSAVREAASKLCCTSVVLINIGVRRSEGFPDAHWMYFYDQDILFSRIHFPHRLSSQNVPAGCGSIQAEIYHSKYKPLVCQDVLTKAVEDLRRVGILNNDDNIQIAEVKRIPYANVLFDKNRKSHLEMVRKYLTDQGIQTCGRYGEWEYYWTDDSIQSGWRAAEDVMFHMKVKE